MYHNIDRFVIFGMHGEIRFCDVLVFINHHIMINLRKEKKVSKVIEYEPQRTKPQMHKKIKKQKRNATESPTKTNKKKPVS